MVRHTVILSALIVVVVILSTAAVTAQTSEPPKYVILRDDDVGLGNETDTLKAVNQVQIDERVPVTLGIVPHPDGPWLSQPESNGVQPVGIVALDAGTASDQLYQDPTFVDYMRTISANPLFEFAQHGYAHRSNGLATSSHSISEFAGEPYNVQYAMIRDGRDDIKATFGRTPTTFIPPWDRGDGNTLEALRALGFTEYCSGGTDMQALHGRVGGIRVEPAFDIYGSSYAALNESIKKAMDRIDRFFSDPQADTTVVAYHFWQFSGPEHSVDLKKVQLLRDFIEYVKHRGPASFTTLDRSTTVNSEEPSATAGNTASSPSLNAVARGGLSTNALSSVLNIAVVPFNTLIILIFGVVLVGLPLYARRRQDVGAGSASEPLRSTAKHTTAENEADARPSRSSSWNQEMLHTYGVVAPIDSSSESPMPLGQPPASAHAGLSAGDSTDE